ncbi:MAG: hypothetical protein O7I93_09690 [Gemmatimonadetes bacterium]|nr:hypothetical protein [Gemmatimonadota bacterium]
MPDDSHRRTSSETERSTVRRSHYFPRTRDGWIATVLFLALFALTQPPFVHGFANRVEPRFFGLPFLYAYLLVLYFALIGVLIWAVRRNI